MGVLVGVHPGSTEGRQGRVPPQCQWLKEQAGAAGALPEGGSFSVEPALGRASGVPMEVEGEQGGQGQGQGQGQRKGGAPVGSVAAGAQLSTQESSMQRKTQPGRGSAERGNG